MKSEYKTSFWEETDLYMEKWFVATKRAPFQEIAARFGIDQVTARIIRNRDIVGDEAIEEYLSAGLDRLNDPSLLSGASQAAVLLKKKAEEKKKIRIIGDYDIDGVCATYILYQALRSVGADVDYEIPDRMKDGYGLSQHLIELAFDENADTVLTCDNGISAIEQIRYARQLGMTVIVTDHHEPLYEELPEDGSLGGKSSGTGRKWLLPPANCLVDPKLPGDPYPCKEICGAVVAWKVVQLLYALYGRSPDEYLAFLPYAAFATVGDVMDLRDENRIIVRHGLKALESIEDPGMRSLIQECGLENRRLCGWHIGFMLGPCINASGRLDTARRSLKLLLSDSMSQAIPLAQDLKTLNEERKNLTEKGVRDAVAQIEDSCRKDEPVLVLYLPGCHESIAGIVAGKIRERYYRPVFVLTESTKPGYLKGSGRSIEVYHMFDGLVRCASLLDKFGGHAMAAGLTLREENLELFRKQLNAQCGLSDEDLTEKVMIDVPMPLSYIREDLIEELYRLEPFGKGNEKPVFAVKNLIVRNARIIGKNRNGFRFLAVSENGFGMDAVYFGDIPALMNYLTVKYGTTQVERMMQGRESAVRLSVTYYPVINEYMGRKTLEISVSRYM